MRDSAAQVAAIRGQRAMIQFRGFSPPERDTLVQALGNGVTVQESPWECSNPLAVNHERKPFDDRRVRRALSLALDRHQGAASLSRLTILREVAGVQGVGTPFATPPAELERLAGYSRDIATARAEARRLLREAGVPEGFAFTFKNRGIPNPYDALGVWLVDQWRQIGLNVRIETLELGMLYRAIFSGDFEVAADFHCSYIVEPDLALFKFQSKLQPLRGPDPRRALPEAEPGHRPRGAPALYPRVRAAPARRGGALHLHVPVAPDRPPQRAGPRLDNHPEPFPEQPARHRVAGRAMRAPLASLDGFQAREFLHADPDESDLLPLRVLASIEKRLQQLTHLGLQLVEAREETPSRP